MKTVADPAGCVVAVEAINAADRTTSRAASKLDQIPIQDSSISGAKRAIDAAEEVLRALQVNWGQIPIQDNDLHGATSC